jgi:hypothetical protein
MRTPTPQPEEDLVQARRRFLAACGKFSVATPPAIAMLLAASERNYAVAASGNGGGNGRQRQGNNGFGNGGGDGVPGRSPHNDVNR